MRTISPVSALIPAGTNDIIPFQKASYLLNTSAGALREASGMWLPPESRGRTMLQSCPGHADAV